jgi:hypothetical protein
MITTQPTFRTEIVIEKNIPLPPPWSGRTNKLAAKFHEMEVGDSFCVPKDGSGGPEKSWDARIRNWGNKQTPPRRFAVRKQPGGTRIWRVE